MADPKPGKARLDTNVERGLPKIVALNRERATGADVYHYVLTRSWLEFFATIGLLFVWVNAFFAMLYRFAPGCVTNVDSFEDAFFFSVQTIATIGYGTMAPATRFGHVVVSFEALAGILSTALITGLTFAKFAKPTARVLFGSKVIISRRDGVPHLMFRMANWRHNVVAEASLRVTILLTEVTREGDQMRRQYDLPLVRDRTTLFMLTWSAMHKIDESSPFHGKNALQSLRDHKAEIFLAFSGLDDSLSSMIYARKRYSIDDVVENMRFADVMTTDGNNRIVDYGKFHELIPIDASTDEEKEEAK